MRKVRFNGSLNTTPHAYLRLTEDKVYDIIKLNDNFFEILNDTNDILRFKISNILFTDVTSEYRGELIDEILK